jgi:NAD(P)H-hydrate epimerase
MDTVNIDESFVRQAIPPREKLSHKRMNGTVCVVGGSRLYHGAPFLCASGAIRSGVDIVYVAVPASIATSIRSLSPDFIVIPLPDGRLTRGNVTKLLSWVRSVDCFAVGPGLGPQNPNALATEVARLRGEAKNGVVLDADALRPGVLTQVGGSKTILTPHAGEFERLFSVKLPEEVEARADIALDKAKRSGATILLKGSTDIITDGKRVGLNSAHSVAMTVGGTGDVLTGLVSGLVAKGVPLFEAAASAAFLNGSAGVEAARDFGFHITATDVVNRIANVMKRFDTTA